MKREILFRGKSPKGHWIYGMPSYDLKYIFNDSNYDSYDQFEVIPETIGQFTGLNDKNGVKAFEGDIVRVKWFDGEEYQFSNYEIYDNDLDWRYYYEFEVIGNIHDNPELIKS